MSAQFKKGIYFDDGKRLIDFILVVHPLKFNSLSTYLENLQTIGVEFEMASGKATDYKFIKVHMPDEALEYCALLYDIGVEESPFRSKKSFTPFPTPVSEVVRKKKGVFTSAERVMITVKVLETTKYGEGTKEYGMSKLVRLKKLITGYPLHDGPLKDTEDYAINSANIEKMSDRQLLLCYLANLRMWYKELPLDLVERYLGPEVGFYFAWLEFFNFMLIFPAIIGSLQFVGSLAFATFGGAEVIKDVCFADESIQICPICDTHCKFAKLSSRCETTLWSSVFDNALTVGFAVLMSVWFTLFIKFWRRRENRLKMRWNLDFEETDSDVRLEYKEKNIMSSESKNRKICRRIGIWIFSVLSVTVMLGIVVCLIVFVIICKNFMDRFLKWLDNKTLFANRRGIIMCLSSILTVICIKLYAKVYAPFSMWLTRIEMPRTQTEFDNSVLYKKFILSFTNNFGAMFYLAFVKPINSDMPHKEPFSYFEKDVCSPNTCTVPLCVQLAFIITLRILAGNIFAVAIPLIKGLCKKCRKLQKKMKIDEWEEQFFLEPTTRFFLTGEVCEMVIRTGHVTFFVAAFPLAPLCVFVNNLLECRSDAMKMVRFCRRPIPLKKNGLGSWNGILQAMMFIAIITNALLVAFTNDFVPRAIYYFEHGSLKGFFNSSLSIFYTADYNNPQRRLDPNVTICYYRGLRNPPYAPEPFWRTRAYWIDFMWRWIMVFTFEHLVFVLNLMISLAIPNVPLSIRIALNLERKEAKEAKKGVDEDRTKPTPPPPPSPSVTRRPRNAPRRPPLQKITRTVDPHRDALVETGPVVAFF